MSKGKNFATDRRIARHKEGDLDIGPRAPMLGRVGKSGWAGGRRSKLLAKSAKRNKKLKDSENV